MGVIAELPPTSDRFCCTDGVIARIESEEVSRHGDAPGHGDVERRVDGSRLAEADANARPRD
jgi:hypothetical protein